MIAGHQISKELGDALGLPPMTRGFTLRCYTGEIVTVECEYYPTGAFQTALAKYNLLPVGGTLSTSDRFNFDAWLRGRNESAHSEFMRRTSRLPPCIRRTYTADEIAKFYGISHGGID